MKTKNVMTWAFLMPQTIMIGLALFLIGWYPLERLSSDVKDYLYNDLAQKCLLMGKQITPALNNSDFDQINRICKRFGQEQNIHFTVLSVSGKVLGDSQDDPQAMADQLNHADIQEVLSGSKPMSFRYDKTKDHARINVFAPITDHKTIIAGVKASMNIAFFKKALDRTIMKIILFGAGLGILGFTIAISQSRHFTKYVTNIRMAISRFAKGDLDYRLTIFRPTESGKFSHDLNQMAEKIQVQMEGIIDRCHQVESVFSSMQEGVMAIDSDEKLININQKALDIFGLDNHKTQDKKIFELIRHRDWFDFVNEAVKNGNKVEKDIQLYIDGEKQIHLRSNPLQNGQGQRIGTLIVLADVTQLRRLENMRQDFAANVSHEIKTPLTAIKGFVETLLEEDQIDISESKRFLNIIVRHVLRLEAIIDDLLKLSRIEQDTQKQQFKFETIELKPVLSSSIKACEELARNKAVGVDLICKEQIMARIDANLFEQAAVNLLDNAIKYSPPNSQVSIKVHSNLQNITIYFADQGIGIEKRHHHRLFERFYRVDKARSRKLGGTGLGLAIVKHIVGVHDGTISIESQPNMGSTFIITLPALPVSNGLHSASTIT